MKFEVANDILTIYLEGRIDSTNSADIENELVRIRTENTAASCILDLSKLEYISSNGLRVILRLRKEVPDLKLINVSGDVYDVFEMTGFTEMMPIEKAFRVLSVEGCEVIGQGSNGKVYRLDPETIIKVYHNPDSLPDIQRERELARKAFVMGIPTAIPYDIVRVGNSYGSVFELLNAKPFAELIREDPSTADQYIVESVSLLKKIHATELKEGDMPDQRTVALGWVRDLKEHLPADQHAKLQALVEAVPHDNHMIHGDYHVKNIMQQNDEVLLIDMDTLCLGYPIFEFSSIYLAYIGFGELDNRHTEEFLGIPADIAKRFWTRTVSLYFGSDDEELHRTVTDKSRVVGYARLLRRTIRRCSGDPEGQKLIAYCKERLAELLPRIDTLLF